MLKRIGFVALVFLGAFAAPRLRADELTGRPFVVAVGIDKYPDVQIKPRKHAEADAQALYDLATSNDFLGAPPDDLTRVVGGIIRQAPSKLRRGPIA